LSGKQHTLPLSPDEEKYDTTLTAAQLAAKNISQFIFFSVFLSCLFENFDNPEGNVAAISSAYIPSETR